MPGWNKKIKSLHSAARPRHGVYSFRFPASQEDNYRDKMKKCKVQPNQEKNTFNFVQKIFILTLDLFVPETDVCEL